MQVVARIREILKAGGKTQGHKRIVYKADGKTFDHYALEHIEVLAEDVLELCALSRDQGDEIVRAQTTGNKGKPKGEKVVLYADHLFHLCDLAGPPPQPKAG